MVFSDLFIKYGLRIVLGLLVLLVLVLVFVHARYYWQRARNRRWRTRVVEARAKVQAPPDPVDPNRLGAEASIRPLE